MVTLLFGAYAHAAPSAAAVDPSQPSYAPSYAEHSDAELTELGTQWEQLSAVERRALLSEVKLRMARDRGRSGVLKIRTTRQYGVVRQADGTTVRVQRQVVRVVPVPSRSGNRAAGNAGRVTFGIGFERRQGRKDGGATVPAREAEDGNPAVTAVAADTEDR